LHPLKLRLILADGRTRGSRRVKQESVKGSLVVGAVVAARRLRDRGRITPEVLEARLSRGALELVDEKINISAWYPVAAFCELIELSWETEGGRDPAFLEHQGAVSADRLFESGRYQQLDFAERARKVDSREQLIRQARLITTITGTFYDFLEVGVSLSDDGLSIVYDNASAFRDSLVHTTVGFKNQINVRQGSKRRWTGERIRSDAVRFDLPLPARLREPE
jgi:hypothetical protein